MGALESESDRQSADLSRLEEMIERLRADADQERASNEERASADGAGHVRLSVPETRVDERSADSSSDFVPPEVGGNRESYLRNMERYIADRGIEVTGDPLSQLVPPHLAAEIRRRFDAEFRPAPWDRWDVGVVALAVLVGALTDYLLVATPGGSFKRKPQRGSPLTAWMKAQSKKLAPMTGTGDVERNAFQHWVATLTTTAERWAKVPYDVVSPKGIYTGSFTLRHKKTHESVLVVGDFGLARPEIGRGRGAILGAVGTIPTGPAQRCFASLLLGCTPRRKQREGMYSGVGHPVCRACHFFRKALLLMSFPRSFQIHMVLIVCLRCSTEPITEGTSVHNVDGEPALERTCSFIRYVGNVTQIVVVRQTIC